MDGAYAEVLPDERVAGCAGFLRRAVSWPAVHGVTVRRVLTDDARSHPALGGRSPISRLAAVLRLG